MCYYIQITGALLLQWWCGKCKQPQALGSWDGSKKNPDKDDCHRLESIALSLRAAAAETEGVSQALLIFGLCC